jgi:hypothetical protein
VAIATEDGPSHSPSVSSEITDWQAAAVMLSSAAVLFQADPAAIIGPDPGPAYMRAELISGGNAAKSKTISLNLFLSWLAFGEPDC